ncbi:hypothetical protein [Streptomyces sp. LN245]|uniref:hypothetical protein n=1 Tax=Streptomyces sp. LN245 TaxID=3112975 RepID=UPI0037244228
MLGLDLVELGRSFPPPRLADILTALLTGYAAITGRPDEPQAHHLTRHDRHLGRRAALHARPRVACAAHSRPPFFKSRWLIPPTRSRRDSVLDGQVRS